jgi:hypothetical protein
LDPEILCRLLQWCQNASILEQGRASFSLGAADRCHTITQYPWRTSSPIRSRLGFRYTQDFFAAAARALGISVATVSRGVTRLEERLGARLFNRTSRQLSLTDFGLTLAERATRIYCEAKDVENAARELSSRPRGLIRLAVPMSFGLRWIAPILPAFFRLYPEVAIDCI